MSKPSPFDYVRAINEKKEMDSHHLYNPFLSNIAFSYSMDTVMLANEMNMHARLPAAAQYDFLHSMVPKRRRFHRWYKEDEHPHLEMVMKHFNYSKQKALEALEVLTQQDIKTILETHDYGGR